jgi:hypothetical protein
LSSSFGSGLYPVEVNAVVYVERSGALRAEGDMFIIGPTGCSPTIEWATDGFLGGNWKTVSMTQSWIFPPVTGGLYRIAVRTSSNSGISDDLRAYGNATLKEIH